MKISKVVLIAAAAVLLSCNDGNTITGAVSGESDTTKECCKNEKQDTGGKTIPEESVFNITSSWKDQDEHYFQLHDLSGSITVAAMIFTSCQSACPQIMGDIKNIESGLSADMQKKCQVFADNNGSGA